MFKIRCTDSSLADLYTHSKGFPTLWELIMQESLRNNHIIFEGIDELQNINLSSELNQNHWQLAKSTLLKVFASNNLREIFQLIQNLDSKTKAATFAIYQRYVVSWQRQIISKLH